MFSVFRNAWKVKDLRMKLFYMLFVLLIVRLGTHVPVPGVSMDKFGLNGNEEMSLFMLMTGGSIGSIFAMGIGPYITSSIIMQLLTVAIPKLEQLKKEGEEGRKKINQATRVVAVALALLQGAGQIYTIKGAGMFVNPGWFVYITALVAMVTGTIFIMWLGEKLTECGIGNGSSFIIFANIIAGLPAGVERLYLYATTGDFAGAMAWIVIALILCVFVFIVGFVILVQDGERRIPVQYSKKMAGRTVFGGQSSFIPIKVNIAGVMSIIFAISLLQFPQTIQNMFGVTWLSEVVTILDIQHPIGAIIYIVLIFCFTFFYTSFAFNPIEVAENMKKSGGFIPGIRPGKPTSEFIQGVVDRISLIGACFYAIIAIIPVAMGWVFSGFNVGFGGTTLLIVTGVALEIVKQLESQLLMRHYKGFLS
ncbi:MAG: preprotein translocase subunit SecY [Clostridiales bacterium]|nr:preprotein translocase subunit SecY [Clostridiales bacterium]